MNNQPTEDTMTNMFKIIISGEEREVQHRMSASGQVVGYEWARAVLYSLGCGLRREEHELQVFERGGTCTYVKVAQDDECVNIGRLFVDEGLWTGAQEFGGECARHSSPWREYVDCVSLLMMVLRKLDPEKAKECHGGRYTGAGFRQQHLAQMAIERLKAIGYLARPDVREEDGGQR